MRERYSLPAINSPSNNGMNPTLLGATDQGTASLEETLEADDTQ